MLTTYTAESAATASAQSRQASTGPAPTSVRAARTVVIVQGAIVLGLGCLLLASPQPGIPAALAVASVIEGLLRITAGILLRRGAHRARIVTLVICGLGIVAGAAAGGVALIGVGLSVLVARCLNTTEAKEHFAR